MDLDIGGTKGLKGVKMVWRNHSDRSRYLVLEIVVRTRIAGFLLSRPARNPSSGTQRSQVADRSGTAPPSAKENPDNSPICSEARKKKKVCKNLGTSTFFLQEGSMAGPGLLDFSD